MTIEAFTDKYIFTVYNESTGATFSHTYMKNFKWAAFFGTQGYPYFGGELPAPHDIAVEYIAIQ
jgi:hypothetical protein